MRHLLRRRDDEGMALVFVVGTMLILAMLALTALAYVGQSTTLARFDADHGSAMAAAQAGVDDFVSHLNANDTYWKTADCTNAALKGPAQAGGAACGWNAATANGWEPVRPGVTGDKAAYFHYSFDSSDAVNGGPVVLTVTGRANGEYRSIQATVGKGSSTDYVYYTDFESADPSNKQAYPTTPSASCGGAGYSSAKYFYAGRSGCVEITFVTGDTLSGPVFSNDAVLSSGATFTSAFTSSNPPCDSVTATKSTWNSCLRSGSTANFGKQPNYSKPQYLDDTSAQFANDPGCHYYGSTRIVFNANGTMTVWNSSLNGGGKAPLSIRGPGDTADPNCGAFPALGSAAGTTVPVPNNEVVYVSADATGLAHTQCDAGQLGGPTGATLPLGTFTKTKAAGKPTVNNDSYTYDQTMTETNKFCQEGNLYVEGVVKGRVSLASAQSVVVTGDLVLAGGLNGSDMLGLVATNSVEIFHPWMMKVTGPSTGCPSSTCKWNTSATEVGTDVSGWPRDYADPTGGVVVAGVNIMGSIQTLQHSFYVQQYAKGSHLGLLQVNGSIAQRWRGIVGQSGASGPGYLKNYVYDKRLVYSSPPYFPHWVTAQWKQRYFGEVRTPQSLRN
ncbi:hypothetical protein [Cellulomonas alba]|uniref:Flp pilus-assembly TadG-like N-terminal domain-containing protein n=1 Tax=Cellulomonas alba TaxID=3053467 RepID=A0ABT7SB55_9CELL|nr:hypothetical protein [Cellulomonas alba]MDM7853410.1 hypothetical protein [Cellulomonas alba]